jgi:hypothetical protein
MTRGTTRMHVLLFYLNLKLIYEVAGVQVNRLPTTFTWPEFLSLHRKTKEVVARCALLRRPGNYAEPRNKSVAAFGENDGRRRRFQLRFPLGRRVGSSFEGMGV